MNPQRIRKEIRALLPPWAAVVGLVAGFDLLGSHFHDLVLPADMALVVGAAMLGGLSFGTEYDARTMLGLLAQPVPRRSIWKEKMTALALALGSLCLLSFLFYLSSLNGLFFASHSIHFPVKWLLFYGIVGICALGATPLFTLLCRSTLMGSVTSIVLPITLLMGAGWTLGKMEIQISERATFWFCHAFLAVYALAMGWLGFRKFMRLQLTESENSPERWPWQIRLPWSSMIRSGPRIFTGPVGNLVRKEFRLQTMSFGVALLFAVIWLSCHFLSHSDFFRLHSHSFNLEISGPILDFYDPIMLMIIGGVSIAGERNLGTMTWQFTLPVPRWKQWCLKLAVILVTCVLLVIVLPVLLAGSGRNFLLPHDGQSYEDYQGTAALYGLILGLGIFASSFARTPVRGILTGLLLFVGCLVLFFTCAIALQDYWLQPIPTDMIVSPEAYARAKATVDWIGKIQALLVPGLMWSFSLLSTYFGYLNFCDPALPKRKYGVRLSVLSVVLFLCIALTLIVHTKETTSRALINQYEKQHNQK